MKKVLLSFIVFCAAIFVGCQRDLTSGVAGGNETILTVSLGKTRISLGGKVGDKYPVYWSEGDKVVVNGVETNEAKIDANEPSVATFTFSSDIKPPYNITYPYCKATSAEQPVVEFPAEQNYTEGSFDTNCAPMCGYSESSNTLSLKHINGVLRFPVTASTDGVVLNQIVITSTNKIAGEFAVDCQNATIEATENSANSITYTVNESLSTTDEKVFYITMPAVDAGSCTVEFLDSKGKKMTSNWSASTIKAGVVREFKEITYIADATCGLISWDIDTDELYYGNIAKGYVKDNSGNPIANVAVSDGFTVVTTDEEGFYSMEVSSDCWYIYISLPAEYEVPINEYGQPCFYKKYNESVYQYNFTLTPLPGGKEEKFALFAFGDGHISSSTRYKRFKNETIPAVKNHSTELKTKGIPCYGITLGDVISNGYTTNNKGQWRDDVRNGYAVSNTGLPVFQVMGNHDNTFCNAENPLTTDSRTSTYELAAQREHEDIFGPVNYSFDRGNAHIIGMRDIIYQTHTSGGDYTYGFLPEQIKWLRQDLALVPKNKMVVLCMHIQVLYRTANYFSEMLALLNQFNEAHIISGHTHIIWNYEHALEGKPNTKVYEHNSACISGAGWTSNLCGDGVPIGYQVFIGGNNSTGGAFTDWYYMGCNEGINTRSHQMRLYRGGKGTPMGMDAPADDASGVRGYYSFNYGDDYIIANVFNADKRWQIKVYEDDTYTGDMTLITTSGPDFSELIGSYSKEDPRRVQDGVESMHDMYVASLNLGVLGRYSESSGTGAWAWSNCRHLYKYKLKNSSSNIKVVAVDRFGNEYTETYFTTGTTEDYNLVKTPN